MRHVIIGLMAMLSAGSGLARDLSLLPVFRVDASTTAKGAVGCASDEDGKLLIAWIDSPFYVSSLRARLIDADGVPLADEVEVATRPWVYEYPPAVSSSGGSFLIAWSSQFDGVYGRGVNPDGAFATEAFQLSENLISWQGFASAAVLGGDYMVQWVGGVEGGQGAAARRFSGSDFQPLGEEVLLSPLFPTPQGNGLAAAGDKLAAVWESYEHVDEVAFQLLSGEGVPLTETRFLSDDVIGYSVMPEIAWGDRGGLAVWNTHVWDPEVGATVERIQVRPIDDSGVSLEPTKTIDTVSFGTGWPTISSDGGSGFFVVWSRGDGFFRDVVVQHLNANGDPLSPITVVNDKPEHDQHLPSVCVIEPGKALVVWTTDVAFQDEHIEARVIDGRSVVDVPALSSRGLVLLSLLMVIPGVLILRARRPSPGTLRMNSKRR